MLVQFKRPRGIDQKNYPVGLHTLPDELESHWYFQSLMKDGDIVLLKVEPKEDVQPTVQEPKKSAGGRPKKKPPVEE